MDSDRASQLSGVDSFIAGGVNTTSPSSPEAVKQQQQSQSHNGSHSETDGHSNDQPIAQQQQQQQQQSEPSILSTVPTLPFAEHFWGPKDEGVKVLLTRMKAGRKTLEGLREMFAERASFEETYGNRLRKLGKVALGQDELGLVRRSLETVNAEMALFAQSHLDLANDIRTILEAPTMMKVREQKSIVKEHQQLVEKNVQARHEIRSQLNKARERIEKEENNMKSIDNPTFGLFQTKDPEKIRVKKDKAIQARINAINEHKALERKLADAQRQWGEDWKMVCNKFEILEEERIHFIREIMFQYSNVMSNVCTKDEETYDRVKNELDRVDPQFELYTFVSERRTGGPETTPGILVPMSTAQYDSSHPSQPGDTNSISRRGTNTNINNGQFTSDARLPSMPDISRNIERLNMDLESPPTKPSSNEASQVGTSQQQQHPPPPPLATSATDSSMASMYLPPPQQHAMQNVPLQYGQQRVPSATQQYVTPPQSQVMYQQPPPPSAQSFDAQQSILPSFYQPGPPPTATNPPPQHYSGPPPGYTPYAGYHQGGSFIGNQPSPQPISAQPTQAPIATTAPTTQIPPMSASAAIAPATAQSNSRPSTPIQQQQTRSRSPSFVSINNNNGEQTTPANIKQQASAGSAAIASPSATSSTPQHQQQPSHASKGTDRRPILFYCRVLYDWAPETDAEIALKEGMIISVFEEAADGWWTGEITDPSTGDLQRGIFPSNYTQRMSF